MKKIFQDSFIPKIVILSFLSQKVMHDWQEIQFAAKAALLNRQKSLMIFSFTIFHSSW